MMKHTGTYFFNICLVDEVSLTDRDEWSSNNISNDLGCFVFSLPPCVYVVHDNDEFTVATVQREPLERLTELHSKDSFSLCNLRLGAITEQIYPLQL